MRKISLFLLAILLCTAAFAIEKTALNNKLNNAALRFTENKGQVADSKGNLCPDILFTAQSGGAKLFVNHTGIHYQFMRQYAKPKDKKKQAMPSKFDIPEIDSTQTYRMDMKLIGANVNTTVTHEGEGEDYENYYLAHCPNGILGVKNYQRITFQNIYPNIDWILYSKGASMEYDFIVHPGGNPKDIQINYDYATSLSLDEQGNLKVHTLIGDVNESSPISYQADGSKVDSKFTLSNNTLRFDIGRYDAGQNLVIDPSIAWATYYGGIAIDLATSVCTDVANNVYMCGSASSLGLGAGGFKDTIGSGGNVSDAILVKFNSAGNRIWATYYGGTNFDYGKSVCMDVFGNVYVAGTTKSPSGIAYNGFKNVNTSGQDAFLVKFNGAGNRIWATYYGGLDVEDGNSVCTDSVGNVYLGGTTLSKTGIAMGGFQDTITYNSLNAFLVKFNSTGNRLWATYYGGTNSVWGLSICTDGKGNIYMGGTTLQGGGLSHNGFQNTPGGGYDAILVKFNSVGNRLWSTYYGGTNADWGEAICTDGAGNVYLTGYAESSNGISFMGFQNIYGGYRNPFLVKFDSVGNRLWATYYCGISLSEAYSVYADRQGNVYIVGSFEVIIGVPDSSTPFGGFQDTLSTMSGGGQEAIFIAKFNSGGSRLWGSYYGGEEEDIGYGICGDALGNIYFAGSVESYAGIAVGGFQNNYGGGTHDVYLGTSDAFLAKIKDTTNHTSIIDPAINTEIPIQLYPNPNTGEFTLELTQPAEVLSVYDLMGRVVYTQKDIAIKTTINLSDLSKGCYVVEVLSKEGRARKMVLVE